MTRRALAFGLLAVLAGVSAAYTVWRVEGERFMRRQLRTTGLETENPT